MGKDRDREMIGQLGERRYKRYRNGRVYLNGMRHQFRVRDTIKNYYVVEKPGNKN